MGEGQILCLQYAWGMQVSGGGGGGGGGGGSSGSGGNRWASGGGINLKRWGTANLKDVYNVIFIWPGADSGGDGVGP